MGQKTSEDIWGNIQNLLNYSKSLFNLCMPRSNSVVESRPSDLRLGSGDNTDYIAPEAMVEDVIVKE